MRNKNDNKTKFTGGPVLDIIACIIKTHFQSRPSEVTLA